MTQQRVYRSTTTGGPYSLVTTFANNTTTTFTDTGLTNGTTYYYVIRAFDGTQESANSTQASAAPVDNTAPAAPTGVSAVDRPADQGGAINLAWTVSTATDVTQQRVYRSTTSGGPYSLVTTFANNTTTTYTDTGLTNGTTYYYVIRAFDGTQESANSTQVSAVPASNAVFHMHNETSALSAARQLRQTGPDVAATNIQSGQLVAGVNVIVNFETQTGDPNGTTTLAASSTVSFTIYLQKTAFSGTMVPYAAAYKNSAVAGNLICSGTGATAVTTTMTAYTFTCAVGAGGVPFTSTDRLYVSVGVNVTTVPAATNRVNVGVEGTLNGARDSRMTVPWP
ncbi:MAG: hypothetical protein HY207_12965 [Nitrospirae bacterium]|nr:hypothetical protein [Nitrospirota bacterium]